MLTFIEETYIPKLKIMIMQLATIIEALRIKNSNFCTEIILERRDKEILEKFKLNKA